MDATMPEFMRITIGIPDEDRELEAPETDWSVTLQPR